MTYPRAFAISESLWSGRGTKDWNDFTNRVEDQFKRLEQAGVNYAVSMYDPVINVTSDADNKTVVQLTPEMNGLDIYYTIDNSIPDQYSTPYLWPVTLSEEVQNFRFVSCRNGKPIGRLIWLKKEELMKRIKK